MDWYTEPHDPIGPGDSVPMILLALRSKADHYRRKALRASGYPIGSPYRKRAATYRQVAERCSTYADWLDGEWGHADGVVDVRDLERSATGMMALAASGAAVDWHLHGRPVRRAAKPAGHQHRQLAAGCCGELEQAEDGSWTWTGNSCHCGGAA